MIVFRGERLSRTFFSVLLTMSCGDGRRDCRSAMCGDYRVEDTDQLTEESAPDFRKTGLGDEAAR